MAAFSAAGVSAREISDEILPDAEDREILRSLPLKRVGELEAFRIALGNPVVSQEIKDDEVFAMLVQLAIEEYGVKQGELAQLLSTSTATVGRWKNSNNAPSIFSRQAIVDAISSLIGAEIDQRQS